MEKGDLIIVTFEWPPDWDWLDYRTGDIGIVTSVMKGLGYPVLQIYFFHNGIRRPVPKEYVKALKEMQ
jgi:hypothetical protein